MIYNLLININVIQIFWITKRLAKKTRNLLISGAAKRWEEKFILYWIKFSHWDQDSESSKQLNEPLQGQRQGANDQRCVDCLTKGLKSVNPLVPRRLRK